MYLEKFDWQQINASLPRNMYCEIKLSLTLYITPKSVLFELYLDSSILHNSKTGHQKTRAKKRNFNIKVFHFIRIL